jgi:hypothetical protein
MTRVISANAGAQRCPDEGYKEQREKADHRELKEAQRKSGLNEPPRHPLWGDGARIPAIGKDYATIIFATIIPYSGSMARRIG